MSPWCLTVCRSRTGTIWRWVARDFCSATGTLRYGREDILESCYTAHLWPGVSASGGLQYIDHAGHNMDRGPVLVEMLRLHVGF